ncbi:TRAP transporter small permease subunit, partial [Litoreibacter halocynthiae]|uniref:TRAP transporter small permease subunit n=1 Tax=Litoreibacter halocynthiae TaxID=1242689 RepID=UPI003D7C76DA
VRRAPMEFESWRAADRSSVFIGRVTMMLVVLLTSVMMFEVVLRYVFEAPTLWANELSLWLAGFVFLCAGLYAMQQRSHIRIFLLYDMMPRNMQRVCDVISTLLIVTFTFFLIYGGYGEAITKFMRWETFGTAFDPPIPATLKPMVLIVVALVAVQAVVNLFSDWNAEPVMHSAADDIDADEIERLKKAVGADGIGDMDVTRSAVQHTKAGQD